MPDAMIPAPMTVTVYPYREKVAHGNILWPGRFPASAGVFPPTHPCAPKTDVFRRGTSQCGEGSALDTFRARGYWASCFPEGDGITWKPERAQSDARCLADIRECFGWDAAWANGVTPDQTPEAPMPEMSVTIPALTVLTRRERAGEMAVAAPVADAVDKDAG